MLSPSRRAATTVWQLLPNGRVVAWGDDSYGQSSVPPDLTNAVAVAAGDYHSLALRADGTVIAWGPREDATAVPVGLSNVVAIAAGGSHSLALQQVAPFLFTPPSIRQTVFSGAAATLSSGLPETASLAFQWSLNGTNLIDATHNQLRLNDLQTNQTGTYSVLVTNAFGLVTSASTVLSVLPSIFIYPPLPQTVFAGTTVNLSVSALSAAPVSYQWRLNGTNLPSATGSALTLVNVLPGQAGAYSMVLSNFYGTVTSADANLSVIGLVEWGVSQLAGMNLGDVITITENIWNEVLVSKADGTVVGWGGPPITPGLTNIVAVATGYLHALALRADGTVVAWGGNYYGQTNVPSPLTNAVAIATGDFHNLALRADGTVTAWGDDFFGATEVPLALGNVVGIDAGPLDSLALTSDGHVIFWGTVQGAFPVPVGLSNVVQVSAGYSHFLALTSEGTVVAWGDNSQGETNVPPGLTNVVAVSAGYNESLALTTAGRVVAWGDYSAGQTKVLAAVSNAVAIAAGSAGDNLGLIGSGPPHLSTPLLNRRVAIGVTASFREAATGLLPLIYQWQFNGTNLAGATGPVLTLTNVQPDQAGLYSVIVSNSWGGTSASALLSVAPVLINMLTTQPRDQPAYAGGSASFSALAQGSDLTYQWLTNGIAIPGATNSALTLLDLQLGQAASYSVIVSNHLGQLTSTSVPLAVVPLWITGPLRNQTNYAGGTASFSIFLQGTQPLAYQWQFNGVVIPGQTNALLTLTNLQLNQAGAYSVLVTNGFGATNSSAWLTVEPIQITAQPYSQTNFPGAEVDFSALVSGAPPLNYQWNFAGTNLPGATDSTLALLDASPNQSGPYSLTISNAYGVVTTSEANLVVLNIAQWPNNAPGSVNFLSIPAQVNALAASDAGWCLVARADGTVAALPGANSGPGPIPEDLTNAIDVSAGWQHAVALRANGVISAWGDNRFGQTNVPANLTNAVSIACGAYHCLALKSDATVVGWGDNRFGQTNVPSNLTNIVAIAAGTNDSLAVDRDGQVFAWGADDLGQPVRAAPDMTNVVAVVSRGSLFLAIRSDGTIAVWPSTAAGPPYVPPGISNIVAIAACSDHDLELSAEGTIVSWANPTNQPASFSNVAAIAAGGTNNFALLSSGPPQAQILLTVSLDTNGFAILLPTQSGRAYGLEYKDVLSQTEWKTLPLVPGKRPHTNPEGPDRWGRAALLSGSRLVSDQGIRFRHRNCSKIAPPSRFCFEC